MWRCSAISKRHLDNNKFKAALQDKELKDPTPIVRVKKINDVERSSIQKAYDAKFIRK